MDPDCRKPNLSDATWIARQHIEPYWVVERRFGYKDGELKSATMLRGEEADKARSEKITSSTTPMANRTT